MLTMETMGPFLMATLTLLLVPGPSVVFVVTRALAHGRGAGLASVAGLEAGLFVHVVAAAAGLSALAASSEMAMAALRVTGVAYLLFLASRPVLARWRRDRAERVPALAGATGGTTGGTAENTGGKVQRSRPAHWALARDAFVVDLLNPQTVLFFLAFLPQFVDVRHGAPTGQLLVLGMCVVLLAFACDAAYVLVCTALVARRPGPGVTTIPGATSRRATRVTSAVYVALAVWATVS
jgi:threonine/homoserine/homoserine lactone efflux protein